ncbi:MAG: phospholipid carrier-dependent glycosyltransferase [Planctomycetes bacterium]|nr:phospholipid carrier-dependent glycosyltransferase [Planctomycetota bacterium]
MSPRLRSSLTLLCGLAAWGAAALLLARFLFGTALHPGEPLRGAWSPLGAVLCAGALALALFGRACLRRGDDGEPDGAPLALSRRAERRLTALALALHVLLAAAMSWDLPLFEGPDESTHFDYARYVAREGELPSLHVDGRLLERDVAIDQKIQPPLYYLLLAPALRAIGATHWSTFYRLSPPRDATDWPARWDAAKYLHGPDELAPYANDVRALHLLRLTGIAFTLLGLLGLRRALRALRVPRATTCLAIALLALLPQLLHLAGVISNDLPAIAASAWAAAIALRWLRRGELRAHDALSLGALLGLACLAKLSGFVLLAWMGCVGIAFLVRHARARALLKSSALVLAGFALSSGWYWAANTLRYGHPLQNWVYQTHYQATGDVGLDAWTHWGVLLPGTFGLSFFCDLGWMAAWPEPPALIALACILALPLVALCSRRGLDASFARAATPRLLVLALLVLAWIAQLRFYASVFQPQGRHHFPFLVAYALPLACALEALRFDLGRRAARAAYLALPLAALLFALHAWLGVQREQFAPLNRVETPWLAITDAHARGAAHAAIEVLEPSADERCAAAPTLRWRAEPGERYSIEIGLDGSFDGPSWSRSRRVVRTFEDLGLELEGDRFAIPPEAWTALFPEGRAVVWRVRRLDPVRHGTLVASEPRRLTRVP